jgi:hypothetical protein
MRRWGIVLTLFYVVIVVGLLVPGGVWITGYAGRANWFGDLLQGVREVFENWLISAIVATILISQALLLFLSVDTSQKRLRPQARIWVSCTIAGGLSALLAWSAVFSLGVGISGDKFLDFFKTWTETNTGLLETWAGLWLMWGLIFYVYYRRKSELVNLVVTWLLRGSVLELLIAVPCHVVVRKKDQCCAPLVTSFGIVTGVAIMLMSFGPSVLFLYKKRLEGYAVREVK